MSAYEALAASYDGLTRDIPYERILRFWHSLLQRHGKTPHMVLDLACGTGSLSLLLAQEGYSVLGVDYSEQMLTVAAGKAMELQENAPYFVRQAMQRLRLPQPVDCVLCCLDSLNYLTKPEDCEKTISRVYDALVPGGVFFFDINTPCKLKALDGQVFLDETQDAYCVWRADYSERENLLRYGMDLFQRQGTMWRRSFEEHCEYAYEPEQLARYLLQAGFAEIEQYGDLRHTAPTEQEQRIYFFAVKPEADGKEQK